MIYSEKERERSDKIVCVCMCVCECMCVNVCVCACACVCVCVCVCVLTWTSILGLSYALYQPCWEQKPSWETFLGVKIFLLRCMHFGMTCILNTGPKKV
jgi:hypothetical protein